MTHEYTNDPITDDDKPGEAEPLEPGEEDDPDADDRKEDK